MALTRGTDQRKETGDVTTASAVVADSSVLPRSLPLASPSAADIRGSARLGRRTKELTQRLATGAVAILDHADLDSVAARSLLACRPVAVIDCRPLITGRYPNRGPALLIDAGIPLFDIAPSDTATPDLFDTLVDGEAVTIRGDALYNSQGARIASLAPLTPDLLATRLEAARAHLDAELSSFVENTLRYLGRDEERTLLLDAVAVPEIRTPMAGRAALVVVRGDGYEEDLRRLAHYIREQRPAVIAVDGAADALLALGVRPDILLGDMDSVSDATLRCGAELIVHAYVRPAGSPEEEAAPGLTRLRALDLDARTFPVAGTSEDAALLLAYEKGADLIVAVGTHTHLEDFLDKGRGGMASTFLVRLKVGSRLVDARGVSRLYPGRPKMGGMLAFLAASAFFPVFVLLAGTAQGQVAWRAIVVWFNLLLHR